MGWRISRKTFAAAALFVVLSGGGASWAQDDTPIARSEEFTKRVKESIRKGAEWLRSTVRADGSCTDWSVGNLKLAAAAYHTLRVCGTPRDDAAAGRAMAYVRAECEKLVAEKDLESLGVDEFHFASAALADHGEMTASVDAAGEPSYVLSKEDKALLTTMANYVEKVQDANGTWSLSKSMKDDRESRGDVAGLYTYAALMGLKTASRCGVKVQAATWDKSLKFLLRTQDPRGETIPSEKGAKGSAAKLKARGWDFDTPTTSADYEAFELDTSNGLASLVICRSELMNGQKGKPLPDPKSEFAIGDGLRFLGRNTFLLDTIKKDLDDFALEFMSALERACGLSGAEHLGTIDWYGEAAEALMRQQEKSGAWFDATAKNDNPEWRRSEAVNATCHALLVLAHGTRRVRWTLTGALDDTDINFGVAPTLPDKDFEDFLDLVLSRWRSVTDAAVKDRIFKKSTATGPRIVAPLVRRLASAKPEERTSAFALLKHATGLEHGFDPAAPDEARATAVAAWQEWLTANEKTLRFDAATGRIVTP